MGIIYKLSNKINGKSYIGQTRHKIRSRVQAHIRKKTKIGISAALRKYGIENFDIEIVEECPIEELNEKEKYYIKKFDTFGKNGYNLTPGGDNIFGGSGENHFINRMPKKQKEKWLNKYRRGKNNPMFHNGHRTSGKNHFLNRMTQEEKEKWISLKLKGEHNYQKSLSKEELKKKCWINHLTKSKKKQWIKSMSGSNNPFSRAYHKNPDKYREIYSKKGLSGARSPISKEYIILTPEGDKIYTKSLSDFCNKHRDKNILGPGFSRCATRHLKFYRGYQCHYFDKNNQDDITIKSESLESPKN